jgi:hypothetical protein
MHAPELVGPLASSEIYLAKCKVRGLETAVEFAAQPHPVIILATGEEGRYSTHCVAANTPVCLSFD